jgi:hypothetical protein
MVSGDPQENSRPVPDPTILTTEQLLREISALKDLVESWIDGLEQVNAEKMRSVWSQFETVERQRIEQKADTKAAVDAALAAQQDAVREQTIASERSIAKSETATEGKLDQLGRTFDTNIKNLQEIAADNKDRIRTLEALKTGARETIAAQRLNVGALVGVASLLFLIISIAVTVLIATRPS